MKIITREIANPMFSKDLAELYDSIKYRQEGKNFSKYINPAHINDFAWKLLDSSAKLKSRYKDTSLTIPQLIDSGQKILRFLELSTWARYSYADDIDSYYFKLFRARKDRIVKVSKKITARYKECKLTKIEEFDILKIVQWLADAKCENNYYTIEKKDLLFFLSRISNYKNKEKLYQMHFGDEYTPAKKKAFLSGIVEIIKDINNIDENDLHIDISLHDSGREDMMYELSDIIIIDN